MGKNEGLTMVELLTVMAITVILSVTVFGNYSASNDNQALDRASQKLAQDFRRVGEMALSGQDVTGAANGFGIYFYRGTLADSKKYIVYKNINADYRYSGDTVTETVNIEKGVMICDVRMGGVSEGDGALSVAFKPPEPTVYVENDPTDSEASIILVPEATTGCPSPAAGTKQRTVKINNIGRIDVTNP